MVHTCGDFIYPVAARYSFDHAPNFGENVQTGRGVLVPLTAGWPGGGSAEGKVSDPQSGTLITYRHVIRNTPRRTPEMQ